MWICKVKVGWILKCLLLSLFFLTINKGYAVSSASLIKREFQSFFKVTSKSLDYDAVSVREYVTRGLVPPGILKSGEKVQYLKRSHEKVLRLQRAIDILHAKAEEAFNRSFLKPHGRVLVSSSVNGYVLPGMRCINVPVFLEGFEDTLPGSGIVGVSPSGTVSKVKLKRACTSYEDFSKAFSLKDVSDYFKRNGYACTVYPRENHLVIGKGCKLSRGLKERAFSAISIKVTLNLVNLTSAAMDFFDNDVDLLAIIAHELSHYYYAHPSMNIKCRNFYYSNVLGSEKEVQFLSKKMSSASRLMHVYSFSRLSFHSRMVPLLYNELVPKIINHGQCTDLFAEFQSKIKFKKAFEGFPEKPLEENKRDALASFEEKLIRCSGTLPHRDYTSFLRKLFYKYTRDKELPGGTLLDQLYFIHQEYENEDLEMMKLYERAARIKLQYYTFEEEADRLAVVFLSMLKVNPNVLVNKLLRVMERDKEKEYGFPFEFNFSECQTKADEGWKETIPVGNYHNPHHDKCYRAYRIIQFIELHQSFPTFPEGLLF